MDYVELDDAMIDALPDQAMASGVTWPHGYSLNSKGLWFDPGEDKPPTHLSGPFTVLGLARDPNGDGWSIALEWYDRDRIRHHHFLPLADLIGDGTEVLKPLAAGGLELSPHPDRLRRFKAALVGLNCGSRVRLVRRSGWHGDVFVLPHATIGQSAGESIVYDGKADAARYGENGTLADWIERVAKPAAGNSRLIMALSLAFAGPVADLLNDEGGGVHLVGGSSLGKSTALVVAGSVWGGGGRGGFTRHGGPPAMAWKPSHGLIPAHSWPSMSWENWMPGKQARPPISSSTAKGRLGEPVKGRA
jgi:putative DNA primase/helicase